MSMAAEKPLELAENAYASAENRHTNTGTPAYAHTYAAY